MKRFGCTGHQNLGAHTRRLVAAHICGILLEEAGDEIVGVTSLAEGADQLFAFAVLAAGGRLHVITPSEGYEKSFGSAGSEIAYGALVALATENTILPFEKPSQAAFLAAGKEIADRSDVLVAVWDGQPAAGKGGTADVVSYARARGIDLRVIWPNSAQRS